MKVTKLTPSVLKRIIAEEKKKINLVSKKSKTTAKPVIKESAKTKKDNKSNKKTLSEVIDESTKLALQEVKIIRALKKIRNKRNLIRKSVNKLNNKR